MHSTAHCRIAIIVIQCLARNTNLMVNAKESSGLLVFSLSGLLDLRLLRNTGEPVDADSGRDVEQDVGPEDAPVAPSMRLLDGEVAEEGGRVSDRAERAILRRIRVLQVAADRVDVARHVCTTSLSLRGLELQVFDVGARHLGVGQPGRQQAFHDVREW